MKFPYFGKKTKCLLGIDFTTHYIKLVELAYAHHTYTLQSCVKTLIAHSGNQGSKASEHASIVAALEQTLQKANVHTTQAAFALDYSSVLFKTIELDAGLSEAELNTQIQVKSEQYFNHPAHELMMDFEILGPSKNHPNLLEIRWVAARKRDVENSINILSKAGLTPIIAEVNTCSLNRAAARLIAKGTSAIPCLFAIVHITNESLLISILEQVTTIYTRVERFKPPLSDAPVTITHIFTQTLQLFFSTQLTEKSINQIFISGEVISENLRVLLEENTGIPTEIANPFFNIRCSHEIKNATEMQHPHEFLISVGLALRIRE